MTSALAPGGSAVLAVLENVEGIIQCNGPCALRQEPLGMLPHDAAGAAGAFLCPSFWEQLRQCKFSLTRSSMVLLGGALDALLLRREDRSPVGSAAAATLLRCQYTSGVVLVAPVGMEGFPVGRVAATKCGLTDHRLLIATAAFSAGPSDPLSLHSVSGLRLAGSGGARGADASFQEAIARLNARLSWLRESLGRYRAALPAGDGTEAPSAVAMLTIVTGGAWTLNAPPAASAGGLLASPALLRSMLAAAAALPAPPAVAAASASMPPPPAGALPPGSGEAGDSVCCATSGPGVGAKRSRGQMEAGGGPAAGGGAAASGGGGVSLAIIVPYRSQLEQNRELQLLRFAEHMPRFLASAAVAPPLAAFHVFVVEQSDDGFKFNRGKALNAGFAIATDSEGRARYGLPAGACPAGGWDAFCFHDVDLLPQPPLGRWYGAAPVPRPLHVGAAWPRYAADNESYMGGILTLAAADVRRVNGFPNNFWGWGGEDDEMRHRLELAGLFPPARPPPALTGAIVDLEEQMQRERGGERASTKLSEGGRSEWRCMWRKELRAYHVATGHRNGLATLRFAALRTRAMGPHVTVVTVDLGGARDVAAERATAVAPTLTVSAATLRGYTESLLSREGARGSSEYPEPRGGSSGAGGGGPAPAAPG